MLVPRYEGIMHFIIFLRKVHNSVLVYGDNNLTISVNGTKEE